jgi:hypothetical protein
MALEALGLASSITALAGAAAAAFRASESMYNISRRVRHARDEIEAFAIHIKLFANVVKTAQWSLKRYTEDLNTQSPVFEYLQDEGVLIELTKYSRRVIRQVKELKGPILSTDSSIPIWTRIKWMHQKQKIDFFNSMMSSVESKLNIILNVVRLEGAYQRGDQDEM